MSSAVKIVDYKGFTLKAAAYHVPSAGRYLSSLVIVESGASANKESRHFKPRCPSDDGLFAAEQEALDAAIALGQDVVDGKV